MLTNIK